ncbi:MAG TPA: hypothetical protein VFV67_22140 [Actinophytocola sp.]|uniref:hypothetical protein n=1 Tax=Actinophytocola sp. TaxID=1872138 RepID=UPI002DB63007|nr:hypothetical protein [Actinophytocola sp.]HEU5473353.1 hypothetical protein [Actinophytocola sp.]
MSVEVVALGGGIFFLLVAIVGGGFAIREISMPRVPSWARAASGAFGVLLLVPFMLGVLRGELVEDAGSPAQAGVDHRSASPGASGIEVDTEPETTGDQVRLTGLAVSVRNDPPRVGDTITVGYSLTNVGQQRIQFEYTFVGARDPGNGHADAEDGNEGRALEPGETISVQGKVFIDKAGTWTLWPCYVLAGDQFCPDRWKAFSVIAQ